MNNRKRITKETALLIYGGGEVGNNCYRKLREQGYYVLAALDRNKSGEHIVEGLYTYQLGTELCEMDKANCIVIICLANGMIHKEVADQLYSMGYLYIIFLPMEYCIGDSEKRKLTRLYNNMLSADPCVLDCTVANYEQYAIPDLSVENGIIRKTSQDLTVWMRMEMLFSESLELWQGDKTKINTKDIYKNRNIGCGNPCETLFDYYALKTESYEAYFDSKKRQTNYKEKSRELDRRDALYRLFKREHDKGMDFFIEGAPEVMWNPRNYCNLVGGHHRTLYLLHEGHTLFPVKMKKQDFEKWYNRDIYQRLKQYISVHKIKEIYAPLPHPCFLNFPARWEDTGRPKLADIMGYLAECNISDMTVLDCSDDEGYFARNMDRIGAKEVTFLSTDRQEMELADLFNQLLYREGVRLENGRVEDLVGKQVFDIVFALDNNVSEIQLKKLGMLCRRFLVMETTKAEEIEKIRTYTKLENYVCIHREYNTGQIWELGIYSRVN